MQGRKPRLSVADVMPEASSKFVPQQPQLNTSPQDPEWLRVPEAIRRFGIGRSSLYSLIRDGEVKTASLRKRGNITGIRLISTDSLRAHIEKFVDGDRREIL
jgi:hypothetical protein